MTPHRAKLYMTKPFKESFFSHGGQHRYQQVKELVVNAGVSIAGEIAARHRPDLSRSETMQTIVTGLSHFPFAALDACLPWLVCSASVPRK